MPNYKKIAEDIVKGANWLKKHPDRWQKYNYEEEHNFCILGAACYAGSEKSARCDDSIRSYIEEVWGIDSNDLDIREIEGLAADNDAALDVDEVVDKALRVARIVEKLEASNEG